MQKYFRIRVIGALNSKNPNRKELIESIMPKRAHLQVERADSRIQFVTNVKVVETIASISSFGQ